MGEVDHVYGVRTHWIIVSYLLLEGLVVTGTMVQYASIEDTVQMTCPFKNVNKWQKLETNDILVACENGETEVNSTISDRISITDDCGTLTIIKFANIDVGIYCCYVFGNGTTDVQYMYFNITIRALTIIEAKDSNIIERKEGEIITLTCYMIGANKDVTLYWKAGEDLLVSNKSNFVTYQFKTQRIDNRKMFVCSANMHSLNATVHLNLILIPRVSVISSPNPPTVVMGQAIVLRCQTEAGHNGTIDSFVWSHDGKLLQNKTDALQFEYSKPDDAGKYHCTAKNSAGHGSAYITVIVNYPPVVENETVYFGRRDRPRTLKCKVSGVPNTYLYSKWLHYTYSNQLVRILDGQANGTLILPKGDQEDLMYEDSGLYTCNVTNNVGDEDGQIWQSGMIYVVVKGDPVLPKPRKYSYIGLFNETTSVNVFVLSFSNILRSEWFNTSRTLLETNKCTQSTTETDYFGQLFEVQSYNCNYLIPNTKIEDFKIYTVKITNDYGESIFNISLISARVPKEPQIIQWHSSTNHIYVKFKPGFNGGYPQTLIIECRKASTGLWIEHKVDHLNTHYYIMNLEPATKYELRMYSFNKLGNSTVTADLSIQTKDERNSTATKYIGFTLGCTFLACLFITGWRFRKAKKKDSHRSRENEQHIQGVGVIVNNLYGSADDLQGSSSPTAGRADVYSFIDRRKENSEKKFQLTDRKDQRRLNKRGSSKLRLNYVDVVFEPKPQNGKGKYYIHGAEKRTPYADIDFSAKADPFISSDEESFTCNEDNVADFVSLEDVQQWNITGD